MLAARGGGFLSLSFLPTYYTILVVCSIMIMEIMNNKTATTAAARAIQFFGTDLYRICSKSGA